VRSHDEKPQAVEPFDACKPGDECPHCAAGRPEAPESAGVPAELSSSTWEVETDEQRYALPPTYHRPVYIDTLRPPGWFCAACWGDSVLTGWPCVVATRHAAYVSRAIQEERQGLGRTIATVTREMQANHEAMIQARNERDAALAELATMHAVAQGNKRHVADNTAILDRVEALTKDTDGGDVDADAEIPVGEIRRALYEPLTASRPNPSAVDRA
jgi:hypothetical protein